MERSRASASTFWSLVLTVVVLDVITKAWAVMTLVPQHLPREIIGDWVRFTLVHNRGAAFGLRVESVFGIDLDPYSRAIFITLTLIALFILARIYRATPAADRVRIIALGLVCGGAVGNLIDRIRSSLGVVDFIDIGIGDHRWPTFNVADMAVSTGAVLLAWALWGEEKQGPSVAQTVSVEPKA
jgi:signal peptidase II